MNLEAYDVESLRQIVRDLQNENEALRAQLHRQNIPAAESMAFRSCRKEDLYDPDQGARIEHPTITREMLSLFTNGFMDDRMYMPGEERRADIIRSVQTGGARSARFKMAAAGIV